ncbi:hypothetical protein N9J46_02410, partial [Candidatus Pelagibacter sp.]|nr:hypothetical protein [Candidatus Pelagibacter sp.]
SKSESIKNFHLTPGYFSVDDHSWLETEARFFTKIIQNLSVCFIFFKYKLLSLKNCTQYF